MKFDAIKALLAKAGDKSDELLASLKGGGESLKGAAMSAYNNPKQALESLGRAGRSGIDALDRQLVKAPFMRGAQDPLFKTDPYTDPKKRNALLALLGLTGAGGAGYAMMDDEED